MSKKKTKGVNAPLSVKGLLAARKEEEEMTAEAQRMVREQLAPNIEEALKRLIAEKESAEKADLTIFFTNVFPVRGALKGKLVRERPYAGPVRIAFIRSGYLANPALKEEPIVLGEIIELESEDKQSAQLIVIIRGFNFRGHKNIIFSGKSAKEIRARDGKTYEDIHKGMDLYRWEINVDEQGEDIALATLLAIFEAWNSEEVSNDFSLVLYRTKIGVRKE